MSIASPRALLSLMSTSTTSLAMFCRVSANAVVAPTLPAPITVIFLLAITLTYFSKYFFL